MFPPFYPTPSNQIKAERGQKGEDVTTKYEYNYLTLGRGDPAHIIGILNQYGRDGWECMTVQSRMREKGYEEVVLWFKREVPCTIRGVEPEVEKDKHCLQPSDFDNPVYLDGRPVRPWSGTDCDINIIVREPCGAPKRDPEVERRVSSKESWIGAGVKGWCYLKAVPTGKGWNKYVLVDKVSGEQVFP